MRQPACVRRKSVSNLVDFDHRKRNISNNPANNAHQRRSNDNSEPQPPTKND